MKKLSLLTALAVLLSFSSCEEDAILGCIDETATNYNALATEDDGSCVVLSNADLILGNWTIDSAEIRLLFPQETITILQFMSTMMTPEEFEDEMGFPMPSSEDEWVLLATEGVPIEDGEDLTGSINITNTHFTINDSGDITELEYQLVNEDTIEFAENNEDLDIESFTIIEVSESNLILSTTMTEGEDGFNIDINFTIYLSK